MPCVTGGLPRHRRRAAPSVPYDRVTAVNDGTNDRVVDTYKGHLLEKRTYANGAYLTHLGDGQL